MQITSGSVKYSRVKKDDDYGIKREAEAVLAFTVNEGEGAEAALEHGFKIAVNYVHKTLGFAANAAPASVSGAASKPEAGSPSPTPASAAPSPAPLNDKEKLLAASLPAPAAPAKPRGRPSAKKPDEALAPSTVPASAQTDLEDILGGTATSTETRETEPPPPVVSDKDLQDNVTRVNGKLKQPAKIHALVKKFVGEPPKTMRDIPADQRWAFIKELEALT